MKDALEIARQINRKDCWFIFHKNLKCQIHANIILYITIPNSKLKIKNVKTYQKFYCIFESNALIYVQMKNFARLINQV